MWGSKYCPRQHHEGCKSVSVVLRKSFGPARDDSNNAYRSTYGVWNDSYGIRCGLWDDVLYQYSQNCQQESERRTNVNVPISKVTTPSPHVRYEVLALPKATGYGPNCKRSRCAAADPPYYYAKPSCATDKRRAKKRRAGTSESSPSVRKYTYSTMAHVQDKVLDLGRCDMTMGLKNIKKVEEPEEIEDLPTCERKCGECSEARSQESKEEEVEMKRSGTQGSGLKTLARTRTVGSNTEEVSQAAEIPVRVLQDVSNNTVLHWSEKIANPVVRRLKIPTPIPRVAFLRPLKPRLKDTLEYEGDKLSTSRLPTPRTTRPIWSSSPASLTSRRVPSSRMPPPTQKLMPGKLAPRLFTPPTTIPLTRTESLSPGSLTPPETEKAQNKPEPTHLQPGSPPLQPLTPTSQESSELSSKQSSKQSWKHSSEQSSRESSKQYFEQSSKGPWKPSEQSSKESSKQYFEQSSKGPWKPSEQSSKESSKQYFEQSSKEPSKPSEQSSRESSNQYFEQSSKGPWKPSEQSSKESSKQYFEQSSKEPSKPSEQSSRESSNQYFEQSSRGPWKPSSEQSSKESSKQSSKSDFLVTSVSDFENSSRSTGSSKIPGGLTPVPCLCSLCGKCERINESTQGNGATIYRNNPLYSPGRALATTMVQNSNTGPSRWRFLYSFVEVMFLVVLAGALTVGMIPYVETVFRGYMADYCGKGKGNGGPQVTADGMQSGVVNWVNCMMDDGRSTLTPVR